MLQMSLLCCWLDLFSLGICISFSDYAILVLALRAHQMLSGSVSVGKKGDDFHYETINMKCSCKLLLGDDGH